MDSEFPNARFQVCIRRGSRADGPFTVRFEVQDGKGILRVGRPGVLIDPPARPHGIEERLTGPHLRASRFLHVWEAGRGRQAYHLARLEESAIDRLPRDEWIPLVQSEDGATRHLLLPDIGPEGDTEVIDDEPTSPTRILANLREDLSGLWANETLEAGPATEDMPLDAFLVVHDPGRAAMPLARPGPEGEERETSAAGGFSPGQIIRLEPALEDDTLVPATPLVRHLRRQLARRNARIMELEEEVRHLRTRRELLERA